MQRLRFTDSGTEANMMALALATHATGRAEVLVFRGGYHRGVLSFGEGVPSAATVPYPFVLADYDDLEGTGAIPRERGTSIASVLVEPMLGSAGCIHVPADAAGRGERHRVAADLRRGEQHPAVDGRWARRPRTGAHR